MKIFKIILLFFAIALAILTTYVVIMEKEYCSSHKIIYSGWVYGFSYLISIISLLLSSWSHKEQLSNQEIIKSRVLETFQRQKETTQQNNMQKFKYQPSAIVEIAMYAMHMASTHRPIKVDIITPNEVELFSIIIDSICSAYKPEFLYAYVDRNNMLVVPTYAPEFLPVNAIEDETYENSYGKRDRKYIERARKRIDEEINN